MKPNMRRNLSGAFATLQTGTGRWRLVRLEPPEAVVYLSGAGMKARDALTAAVPCAMDIEWRPDRVMLKWNSARGPQAHEMQGAIIHEPLPSLYEALPLATFDSRARRFWRRVFFLVRIPGGRRLLGVLARRARHRD